MTSEWVAGHLAETHPTVQEMQTDACEVDTRSKSHRHGYQNVQSRGSWGWVRRSGRCDRSFDLRPVRQVKRLTVLLEATRIDLNEFDSPIETPVLVINRRPTLGVKGFLHDESRRNIAVRPLRHRRVAISEPRLADVLELRREKR
jgi:hypothetical protein